MQILSADKIRAWDQFTIQQEPITSLDLIERAAGRCFEWLIENGYDSCNFSIFCGKGNNGGDGLVLARLLHFHHCRVAVYILEFGHKGTEDFQSNLARLHETKVPIVFIQSRAHFHPIPPGDIIIDAIYGTGLNRPLEGVSAEMVEFLNESGNEIIALDIPSGIFTDQSSKGNHAIKATHTLSFQCLKPAFLVAENASFVGDLSILNIGLDPQYLHTLKLAWNYVESEFIKALLKPRNPFSHKGHFGHALLIAGSHGKMGAAVLAAKACLRSGAGLLTVHIPAGGYEIMQVSLPEAMVFTDPDKNKITTLNIDWEKFNSIGIGPGLGTDVLTSQAIHTLLQQYKKPLVLDADALNILSNDRLLLEKLPPYCVLTPHPKEFERLFGEAANDFDRIELARQKAIQYQIVIVLKGHYTLITHPNGMSYFNSTGNAGMAKGGSGDLLTGIITSLVAQGYEPAHAAILGVYLHGLAGDYAATYFSEQSMLASDIVDCLGDAFSSLEGG